MFSTRVMSCAAFAWLAAMSFSASAQEGRSDLPTTQVTVPSVQYQSVFSDYKGYQDFELTSWKKANEQVAETSGHAGHDMSSMPGHDMSTIKKEEPKTRTPTAGESSKEGSAMRSMSGMNHGEMKGMNHGDMKGMHNMQGKEKQ